jgi:sugar lactone lactonase YvrE
MTTPEVGESQPFIDGIEFGEGPRRHEGRLWFTDGFAGKVYSAGESGDLRVEAEIARASGLGWLPDGTLVVSTLFDTKIYHVDGHGSVVNTFDQSDIGRSTNDLLVTDDGSGYVDVYRPEGDAIGLLGRDGAVRIVASGLSMPNGLALLPDGKTLVVSESRASRILAFPVDVDGSLGAPSVFADLGPDRQPDGLCVDIEGGVWVGCVAAAEFLRVVAGGAITHRVPVDRGWAIAPALGGCDGRTLYMVVNHTSADGIMKRESTGQVLQSRVDIPASGSP